MFKYYIILLTMTATVLVSNCGYASILSVTDSISSDDSFLTQLTESTDDSLKLQLLETYFTQQSNPTLSNHEVLYDRLVVIAETIQDKNIKANFLMHLTSAYSFLGTYEKAIAITLKAKALFQENQDQLQVARSYYILGLIYNKQNSLDKSLENLLNAIDILENQAPTIWLAHSYNALGSVYNLLNRNKKSFEYYQKAIAQFKTQSDTYAQGLAYNNLGLLMQEEGNFESALTFLLEAQTLLSRDGDTRIQTNVTANLATVYMNLGSYQKAENMYQKCENLALSINDSLTLGNIHAGLGELYHTLHDLKKATTMFRKALPNLPPINAMSVYESLAEIDTLEGNYKAFAQDFQAYILLKDSIFKDEKMLKISAIENLYETKLKDKEILLLQKENTLKQRQIYLMIIAVIAILLLFIALFFRYRALHQERKLSKVLIDKHEIEKLRLEENYYAEQKIRTLQKEKYTNEIKEKNRELASASLYLINKNQVLQTVKNKLEEILKVNKILPLKPIIKQIDSNINLDEDWEQFKLQFEKVNPDFFETLANHYDQLTDSDIRFLSYMRINLSTKEIAQMLNISSKSANMTRYRIRKKVGLSKEADLMEFVRSI